MIRYRRYRVFLILAVFAVAALYHFTTLQNRGHRPTYTLGDADNAQDADKVSQLLGEQGLLGDNRPEIPNIEQKTTQTTIQTTSTTSLVQEASLSENAVPSIIKIEQSSTLVTSAATSVAAGVLSSSDGQKEEVKEKLGSSVTSDSLETAPASDSISSPSISTTTEPKATPDNSLEAGSGKVDTFGLGGKGRHEVSPPLSGDPIHWTLLPQHFPVPTESLITLPTAKPKSIPKIQFAFKDEASADKIAREEKQTEIKEAFKHAWAGYRQHAWLHDEIKPISGSHRDPFCSWAATLVDSLDTLLIMGLDEEFKEAVDALSQIDFTTTPRSDIPVFETTIRYLGGLLAAHDLSRGKYQIIIEKAIELANVLMGAFDTPNRMPIMYYYWKPTFSSNPHRAGTRAVLAELGSLSMEFTRLAQITGDDKYYDAVARITNELELYQPHTKVPGLWPKYIDTSGCKKPEVQPLQPDQVHQIPVTPHTEVGRQEHHQDERSRIDEWPERNQPPVEDHAGNSKQLSKRQLDIEPPGEGSGEGKQDSDAPNAKNNHIPAEKIDCQPQGLSSPPSVMSEHFTFGGAADSTYEYLPKQYLLLGGLEPQYRKMYEDAIDAANEYLLFRPMIPEDDREILVVGSADVQDGWTTEPENFRLSPDQSHLLCFTGGMWGIGAKIFGREADMDIAKKLTDGCVWGYEATKTGIMPESMSMIPCDSRTDCQWNQTAWYSALDPFREQREENQRIRKQNELEAEAQRVLKGPEVEEAAPQNEQVVNPETAAKPEQDSAKIPTSGPIAKRQIIAEDLNEKTPPLVPANAPEVASSPSDAPPQAKALPGKASAVEKENLEPSETPNPYPTHEEYVEGRIRRERLPIGVPAVRSKDYILRPEAIESVFIMYRLTGDKIWREKGWKMFQSIQRETLAEYGNSAIKDVMRPGWDENKKDQMESFWLAETLKYFYLLFSPPGHISLDDYVLNTEAHPFKRPK